MIDKVEAGVVIVAAVIAAAIVEVNGGDPEPYLAIATAGVGYAFGHAVQKRRSKKS